MHFDVLMATLPISNIIYVMTLKYLLWSAFVEANKIIVMATSTSFKIILETIYFSLAKFVYIFLIGLLKWIILHDCWTTWYIYISNHLKKKKKNCNLIGWYLLTFSKTCKVQIVLLHYNFPLIHTQKKIHGI